MTDVSVKCTGPVRGVMANRNAAAYRVRNTISKADDMDLTIIVLPCGVEGEHELQCGGIGVGIVVRQFYVPDVLRGIQAGAMR